MAKRKPVHKVVNLTTEQKRLLRLVNNSELSQSELEAIIKHSQKPTVVKTYKHYFANNHVKIGYISDTHIGEKAFDEEFYLKAIQFMAKEKVEAIYHAGDIVEGPPKRDGAVFNQNQIGAVQQTEYAAKLFDQSKIKIYGISGNHDDWYKECNNAGVKVLDLIAAKTKKFENIGSRSAYIKLAPKVELMLRHPGDGSAYADSYKGQKYLESIAGDDNKPDIIINGHYHKALSFYKDDMTYIEGGTLCDKTQFQLGKNLSNQKGFGILDIWYNKGGVKRVNHTFIPGENRW